MTENKEQWEFSLEELYEDTPVDPGIEALAKHFADRAEQTMNSVLEQKPSSLSEPVKFWPEGAPENEISYSFEYTVNPWPADLRTVIIPAGEEI